MSKKKQKSFNVRAKTNFLHQDFSQVWVTLQPPLPCGLEKYFKMPPNEAAHTNREEWVRGCKATLESLCIIVEYWKDSIKYLFLIFVVHLKYYAEHEKVLEPCRPTYIDELTISILEFHLEVSKEGNLKQTSWQSSTASDMTQITTPIFLPQHQSFITRLASFLFHIKTWSFLWHQSFMSRLGHYSFDIFWMMQSSSMEASQFLPSNWILQRKHYYCHILQALMKLFQFIVYCIVYYIVYYIVMYITLCCPHN